MFESTLVNLGLTVKRGMENSIGERTGRDKGQSCNESLVSRSYLQSSLLRGSDPPQTTGQMVSEQDDNLSWTPDDHRYLNEKLREKFLRLVDVKGKSTVSDYWNIYEKYRMVQISNGMHRIQKPTDGAL